MYEKYRAYVKARVGWVSLHLLLAEECSELAQSSLKELRACELYPDNPTPMSAEEARKKRVEETGDVLMILDLLDPTAEDTSDNPKWKRWAERLGYEEENNND